MRMAVTLSVPSRYTSFSSNLTTGSGSSVNNTQQPPFNAARANCRRRGKGTVRG